MDRPIALRFIDECPFDQVGGKGINLSKMKRFGIPVPDGFIITTATYEHFIKENSLEAFIEDALKNLDIESITELEKVSKKIREQFHKAELPKKNELIRMFSKLTKGKKSVAVRSSATAEDLPTLSFAGQHDTFLNIHTEEGFVTSVLKCFSSVYTARAIQYRARNDIEKVSIAVVVQLMVKSDSSGVMFTSNPITGNREEVVIEAIKGLGEALVSGMVEPDTFIVSKGKIMERNIRTQKKAIVYADDGTKEIEISEDSQKISDEMVLKIASIGKEIEEKYGSPQDIEWGVQDGELYILQSRGITTLYPIPKLSKKIDKVYFSVNMAQGVLQPFTPLGAEVMTRFSLGGVTMLNFHKDYETQTGLIEAGGRLWVNVSPILRHHIGSKVFLSFVTIAEPVSGQILEEMKTQGRFDKPVNLGVRSIQNFQRFFFEIVKRIKRIMGHPDRSRRRIIRKELAYVRHVRKRLERATSIEEKLDIIEEVLNLLARTLFLELIPFLGAGYGPTRAIATLAKQVGENINPLELLKSVPNNVTTQMNLDLWKHATVIKEDAKSMKYFTEKQVTELSELYSERKLPHVAQSEITKFLDTYGMRGTAEIDVGLKRWRENPAPIISHLKGYVNIDDPENYPDIEFTRGRKEVHDMYNKIHNKLVAEKGGAVKASILKFMFRRTRSLAGMREFPKFVMVNHFWSFRMAFKEIGLELKQLGEIEETDDIFYLKISEIRKRENLSKIVRERKNAYSSEMKRRNVPRVITSKGEFYSYPKNVDKIDNGFKGSPASPGVVTGVARVIMDPFDSSLKKGEILVCPSTDPSWTPLFQITSALIMEVGGMMTHGSVVARENGIPAVVGVHRATELIKDGMQLRVNGSTGIVEILEE